ncbi:MAG: sulfatase [Saprospiraceae bacterium]|nr:sulfatase [Saprospiraceae bacterium]
MIFTLFALILIASACKRAEPITKPNIVYILTDQWRASAFGYAGDPNVKTSNIDKFAQEAVNFANAVSVCPVCTPHRAALLTGRYPTSTGMFLNDLYLPDEELCMAEIFKAEGYKTGYLGKWHLDGHGRLNNVEPERRQGFEYWKALECSHDYNEMAYYEHDNPEIKYWDEYSPNALAKDAISFISQRVKSEERFLLFVSIATPHFPHHSAPAKYRAMYPREELILAPNVPKEWEAEIRKELQGYYAHCTATDEAIGHILQKMMELDLLGNTIIVLSSDHGEMMGAHGIKPFTKQLAWDESIRVPFLIRYPAIGENRGAVINAPISTPDILPSLLGLANIEIPESVEGENLSDLIRSPDPAIDRVALVMNVCPFTREYVYPEYRAIRTKQYTYARTLEGASKLFDNLSDPFQMTNLVDKLELKDLQREMDTKLNLALEKIGDDFNPRDHYLQKWNLKLDSSNQAINYRDFLKGEGVVQTPMIR